MKLYYHPSSGNSRVARLAAGVLGIALDLQLVDLDAGAQKQPAYLAINPNGMVPTLDDDGFVLWESNAIAQYLASKKTRPDLFPSDPKVRADVARWQCWDLAHWNPSVRAVAFERLFKKRLGLGDPDPAAIERGLKEFHRFAGVLDGRLKGREWLVNGHMTLADLAVAARLTYAGPAALPLDPYADLRRWLGSIQALDAWKQTMLPA